MHPLLMIFLMLISFLVATIASALTIAYGSWIPYGLFIGVFSAIVYFTNRERKTFGQSVSDERRERAMQEYVEAAKKKE